MPAFDIGSFRTNVSCWFRSTSPGMWPETRQHIARLPRFYLVTEGKRLIKVNDTHYELSAGHMLCVAADSTITKERGRKLAWKGYRLTYMPIPDVRAASWVDLPALFNHLSAETEVLFRAMSLECLSNSIFAQRRARAYLELLLTSLAGMTQDDSPARRLEHIITADLATNYSLADIARESRMSEAGIKRYLKKHRGETFQQFKRSIRINKAKQLLEAERDEPLANVAEQLGFYDAFHFSRSFKAVTGLSPSEYRRSFAV